MRVNRIWNFLFVLVLAAGVASVYVWGIKYGYVFDDLRLVDGTIQLDKPYALSLSYRSLWVLSYPWIHQTLGESIVWQRVFNLVLHAGNGVLVFLLAKRFLMHAISEECYSSGVSSAAWFDANAHKASFTLYAAVILWVLNPVAVYAVAYLIQRSTLMATMFILLFMLSYIEALRGLRWLYVVAAVSYVFVLLSKEHGASAILLTLPLYVYFRRPEKRTLLRVGGVLFLLFMAVVGFVLTRKGWKLGAATEDMVQPFLESLRQLGSFSDLEIYVFSVINQMSLFFRYAFLWIIPWVGWMSIDIRVPFPTQWFSIQLLGALGYLGLVIYAMWVIATRRGFVSLLGIVVLIPAVLFVTEFAYVRLQEPFVLYRSYMWFFTLPVLAWLAVYYLSEFRSVVLGVLVILIFGFTLLSYERVGSFRNEYTVWKDAVEKLDLNAGSNVFGRWRAPLNFSLALINMGSNEEGLRYAALSDRLGAPNGLAKFNQAAALSNLGQLEAALDFYNKAELDGFTLKGSLYKDKGLVLAKLGRYDDALENFDLALTLLTRESERSQTLLAAGRAANSAGEYRRAISYYQQLSELQPDATAVPIGVAFANYKLGNVDAALDALNRSLAKKPTAEVLHARAFIFKELGNKGRALNDINVAIVLAPQNPIYQQFRDQILKD